MTYCSLSKALLDGQEWSQDKLDKIARLMDQSGYTIRDKNGGRMGHVSDYDFRYAEGRAPDIDPNQRRAVRIPNEWHIVQNGGSQDHTSRLRIDGGWLYRTRLWSKNDGSSVALTFVPDKDAGQ